MREAQPKLERLSQRKPLPILNGVGASTVWLPKGPWLRIIDFLCDRFPSVPRAEWTSKMAKGYVVSETGIPITPDSPYLIETHLFYYRSVATEKPIPFAETILYEDENLLVADKPHFLATIPSGPYVQESLLVRLQKKSAAGSLSPIHRLDRDTAGVVVFCKNSAQRGTYQTLFVKGQVHKKYHAVAPPLPNLTFPHTRSSRIEKGSVFFLMMEAQGIPNSLTTIDVIAKRKERWLYQLIPSSGKKHQLRVHMSGLGAPILHDRMYPILTPKKDDRYEQPLQLLAHTLSFTDPLTHQQHHFVTRQQLQF